VTPQGHTIEALKQAPVELLNGAASGPVLLVCEHASNSFPEEYGTLGLSASAQVSHIAWDPGALAVARHMAAVMDAKLVAGTVSRLIYDCNRPPEASGAMPAKSELFVIPGNASLTAAQRQQRVDGVYNPFSDMLAGTIAEATLPPVLVTIHSFTKTYHGKDRPVEVGILHDTDARLADAMLALAPEHTKLRVERNEPYGPEDGVTHTLKLHALPRGLLNVMIEVRNDLLTTTEAQQKIAAMLVGLIEAALVIAKGQSNA